MAAKTKTVYVCSECGYESAKWIGRCNGCGAWNTMVEDIQVQSRTAAPASSVLKRAAALSLSEISESDEHRFVTGISELDRVLGGGIVKGSVVLLRGTCGFNR